MKLPIGENIRKHRRRLGWTQEQLAERLGTSVQSVSRWESGGGYPDMELLPRLARVFAVSVDTLLGCGEAKKTMTQDEIFWKINDFFLQDSPEPREASDLLRTIRLEHLQAVSVLLLPVLPLRPGTLSRSAEFMKELRLLAEEYWAHGTNQGMKQNLICLLVRLEDDEHFAQLLQRYGVLDNCDISRRALLFERAWVREERETCRILKEEQKLADMLSYMVDYRHIRFISDIEDNRELPQTEAAYWREESERKLGILHLINAVTPAEKFPLSGDGRMDLWTPVRVHLGLDYAAQLAGCGEKEMALAVLEDAAELTEQASDFPTELLKQRKGQMPFLPQDCPRVENRTPDIPHIRAHRSPTSGGKMTAITFHTETAVDPYCNVHLGTLRFADILAQLTDPDNSIREGFCPRWLDPIRDHPRYIVVVERLQACRERLNQNKEEHS